MLLGISSSTDKAPGFQRSVLLNNSKWSSTTFCIPSCNQNITIFLKTIHGFTPALHRTAAVAHNTHLLINSQIQSRLQILDVFKPGLFSPACFLKILVFPLLSYPIKKKLLIQILVNLILESGLVTLQSLHFLWHAVYNSILPLQCSFPFKSCLIWIQNYLFLLLESIPPRLLAAISISSPKHYLFLSTWWMPEYLPTVSTELKHRSHCFPASSKCVFPIPVPALSAVLPNVTLIDWMGHLSVHKPTILNLLCQFMPLLQHFHRTWKNKGKPIHSATDIVPQVTGRTKNS